MILIHAYRPRYVEKLFQYGIALPGDGFKINQTRLAPEDQRFNLVAAEGGAFFRLMKEAASCFYVDRMQGGTFYYHYKFSKEIIDLYREKTEVDFLGFQVHELGNTRAQDWKRIQRCLAAEGLSWNEENIYNSVRKISADKDYPHFSQGPAGEYAALTPPKTVTEFVGDLDYVLEQRQKTSWGNVLKCDDGSMYCRSEERFGIRNCFIEVGGAASPDPPAVCLSPRTFKAIRKEVGHLYRALGRRGVYCLRLRTGRRKRLAPPHQADLRPQLQSAL